MIAILTKDDLLTAMLTLEVTRSGLSLCPPEQAGLWLADADMPVRPADRHRRVTVGFAPMDAMPRHSDADLLLILPYDTRKLQEILHRYGGYYQKGIISHLPGSILVGGRRIAVSPGEERLFLCLLEKRGEPVSEATLREVLGSEGTSNTLQVLLCRLRKKLSPDGLCRLRAVRGQGYVLTDGV